jgi:hypothetical protein
MNDLLSSWYIRAALVGFGTYFAWKHLPIGPVGKTITLAIGGVATAGIVAGNSPIVAQLLAGNVGGILPTATTTTA